MSPEDVEKICNCLNTTNPFFGFEKRVSFFDDPSY